jgi:hypothetical protein
MRFFILLIAVACGVASARAEESGVEPMTVHSLLSRNFSVVGAIPSPAGPGVLLQKQNELIICFVSETRTSKSVATQYCKPVE